MATSPPATLRCEQPKRGIACSIKRASFSVPSLLNTAAQDGKRVRIGFGKDPGQAGKSQALHLVRALSGFTAVPAAESGDKTTRFGPFNSQCRIGNVNILRGLWNDDLFRVLEVFPDLTHDDEVDACSGALEMLNPDMKGYGMFEFYRKAAGLDDYGAQLGDAAATSVVEVHKGKAGPGHRVLQERDRRCRRQAMLAAQMQKSADKAVAAVSIVIGATRPVAVAGKKSSIRSSNCTALVGCATMTPLYDEPDGDAAIDTLRRAREIGVDFLDNSEAYGQGRNEELIAHAVKGYRDICGPGLELDKKPGVDELRILVLGAGRSFHRAPGQG